MSQQTRTDNKKKKRLKRKGERRSNGMEDG
jgi:hypothetical protein